MEILYRLEGQVLNMNTRRETFTRAERLCSARIISGLFEDGNIFYTPLFKVVWKYSPAVNPYPVQVAFSISKKAFRLAVTRNLIRRRIREAWRKNKSALYDSLLSGNRQIVMIVIMRGESVPGYKEIEYAVKEVQRRLITTAVPTPDKC